MKNMTAMNAKRKQAGFTIIELVVVILLLGILTATALPRFMDVTDEAHEAVIDATQTGLSTSAALFRAQWTAEGQPSTAVDPNGYNLFASSAGYPTGTAATKTVTDCLNIYKSLLQVGRPEAVAVTQAVAGTTDEADLEGAASADFVAILDGDPAETDPVEALYADVCEFYYVGQFSSGTAANPHNIPLLTYDMSTGEVARGTALTLNTD